MRTVLFGRLMFFSLLALLLALVFASCGQGEPATVRVEINLALGDAEILNAGESGRVAVALYHRGAAVPLEGTEETFFSPVGIHMVYQAKRKPLVAGDYDLMVSLDTGGGGKPVAYVTPMHLYSGRENHTVVSVPRQMFPPSAPGSLSCFVDSYTNTYLATLSWSPVYNADSYEVQIKSFTSGSWTSFNDTTWNNLSGGTVYNYTNTALSPSGAPVYSGGSLGTEDGFFSVGVTRPNSATHYTARIRAVNSYGKSAWKYLPTLMNPVPSIINASNSRVSASQRAVNVVIGNVDYETQYEMEFYNLRGTAANLFSIINGDDHEWENYRPANTANIGSMQVYKNSGSYFYNDSQPTPAVVFQPFNNNNNLCFRIRAVVTLGGGTCYSPWAYYTQIINTGQ